LVELVVVRILELAGAGESDAGKLTDATVATFRR
jgi:hypothetical protein